MQNKNNPSTQSNQGAARGRRGSRRGYQTKRRFTTAGPKLRVIGLGGLEEVGRNMTIFEYGNDIVIIDMGLQFPEEDMPGIDYIIPDISYLRPKAKNIRGVIITHAHYDHIGAISHLMPDLGYPTIYTMPLTAEIIKKRHEEYRTQDLNISIIKPEAERLQLGNFNLEFFRVNHNIPDSMGVALHTPLGTVIHTGDFKIDLAPVNDRPADLNRIAQLGGRGILALLADSTNAPEPGHQVSEAAVSQDISKIFEQSKGMIIVGTFASMINRVQQIIRLAEQYDRKVYLDGRSMKSNIEIAYRLKYLKINPKTLISESQLKRLPRNKLVLIGTGAQGEKNAVLMRIANNDHKHITIQKGDSVVFSSSVIPGNERTIQGLKDVFYHRGAKVYHYKMMDVHAGGHAQKEDLKLMMRLLKPQYHMPIEANYFMRVIHGDIAMEVGLPEKNVLLPLNGQVTEFTKRGRNVVGRVTAEKVPTEYIMVDGLGVGDVSSIVLRDRQVMAEDGMFVVIVTVSAQTGDLVGSPDIISRGFVYMKESRKLIENARTRVKHICKKQKPGGKAAVNNLRNEIRDQIGQYLFQQTKRRPMVLPVVIEV
jgi:ribonuclease J